MEDDGITLLKEMNGKRKKAEPKTDTSKETTAAAFPPNN
jgi:hypothetical protein